jgi:hypothetical protein
MSTAETPAQATKHKVRSFMFARQAEALESQQEVPNIFKTMQALIAEGKC